MASAASVNQGGQSSGVDARCVVAAPPPPEARLERTLLVALIAFTFHRLACDRPLTPAECRPPHPSPQLIQTADQTGSCRTGPASVATCEMGTVPPGMNRRGPGPSRSRSYPPERETVLPLPPPTPAHHVPSAPV